MARKRKKFWNQGGIKGLGLDDPPSPTPAPLPGKIEPGHSTPGAPESDWLCLRCEQLRDGREPIVPDHTPRCPFRGTGRDPEPRG